MFLSGPLLSVVFRLFKMFSFVGHFWCVFGQANVEHGFGKCFCHELLFTYLKKLLPSCVVSE